MKKVLIIAYYWPPAGGPGVQRWLKFVKYLPDFGIEPIMYVPENPSYPIVDKGLLEEIPANLKIIRLPIFEPYALAGLVSGKKARNMSSGIIPVAQKQSFTQKLALWIRGNLFIPDARKFWVAPSVRFLTKYISENAIDTVITSGPPHSLHLIGLQLKKQNKITWFADFRDPWTTIGYHKELKLGKRAERKHRQLENVVLNSADRILVTSPTTASEFKKMTSKPITVITNGFDEEKVEIAQLDLKFSMAHIGSLLSNRNPLILWEVLRELIQESDSFAKAFELKLIGVVSQGVLDSLASFGLDKYVTNLGYLSHQQALIQQRTSRVLLLIEIDSPETRGILPGKLYEYMASRRPVLAIGPLDSDMKEILEETNSGIFINPSQKELLKESILNLYCAYANGTDVQSASDIEKYSRRNLTRSLAELLK